MFALQKQFKGLQKTQSEKQNNSYDNDMLLKPIHVTNDLQKLTKALVTARKLEALTETKINK